MTTRFCLRDIADNEQIITKKNPANGWVDCAMHRTGYLRVFLLVFFLVFFLVFLLAFFLVFFLVFLLVFFLVFFLLAFFVFFFTAFLLVFIFSASLRLCGVFISLEYQTSKFFLSFFGTATFLGLTYIGMPSL